MGSRRTVGRGAVPADLGTRSRVKTAAWSGKVRDPEALARTKKAIADAGLASSKAGRISGRVSPELIERAKARTGIASDTELIEVALAMLALEDPFPETMARLRGTIDLDLDFGLDDRI